VGRLTLRWEGQIVESNRHVQLGDRWARGCFKTYWVELPVAAGVGKDSRLDVIITPDPDYAAIHTFVSRIWGEPIEILDVPVQWPP
jgi:hypothetical protein